MNLRPCQIKVLLYVDGDYVNQQNLNIILCFCEKL
jgi:hypothetical protein